MDDTKDISHELSICTYTDNNCIITQYKQNAIIIELLINNAFYAVKSARCDSIFEPIPQTWTNAGLIPSTAIKTLGINVDYDYVIEAISTSISDESLITKINEHTYGFIKFIVSTSNTLNISKCTLFSSVGLTIEKNKILQYEFNYSSEVEEPFKKVDTVYLYHGSPFENWYSIMRNGIKIGSKNKKIFLHGAVYGDGIYLSNDINLSLGYTSSAIAKYMLAIYEVIANPKWKKTENIFVIDDENALILRYIIVLNQNGLPAHITQSINDKLKSGAQKQFNIAKQEAADTALSTAFSRRLMMEYRKLMKQEPDTLGFSIKLAEDDNLRVWQLFIHKIENDRLQKQMKTLNIPYIEMEFTFPPDYPIKPPFVRIVYPQFHAMTGHITIGGSICMEALSPSGWVPTTNIEAIILQIKLVITDGGANINESSFNTRYTKSAAEDAFKRAMAVHGWN